MPLTIIDRLFPDRRHRLGRRFDRRHGVETTATVSREGLYGMPAELREHAGVYAPSNVALFRRIVRKSGVDPSDFTFVDLGSGKGRIAMVAAEYRFRAILGIEADTRLHEAATENLRRWGGAAADSRISVVNADARIAGLPEDNLFIYMYSPFRGPVFRAVAERLAQLAREPARAVVIAYSSDWEADLLEATEAFHRVRMPRRQFWSRPTVSFFYNPAALEMRRKAH